ncbi:MAG: efflux RND transporter periplasmic adaptor subunit [Proteobacteria bacterium]|nr:efflux RND transporter periplasmic adaptor subunit [Pseudomonadota bacterium]
MRNRQGIAFVIVLALVACGSGADKAELPPATGPGAKPRPQLPAFGADKAPSDTTVVSVVDDTTGTTYPIAEAKIAPKMTGLIDKVLVREGDSVKKGTILFRLRTDDIALRVRQAKAGLEAAEVRLAAAKVEYDRTRRLFDKSAVNQVAWDRVQAEHKAAEVGVQSAKAALRLAQQGWSDAVLRSPIAGIVTEKLMHAGEMATMVPPSVVVMVEDHSTLELRFRLPEKSLKTLAVGDVFEAEFTALEVTRDAEVVRIAPRVDARTRTVEVVATIDNKSGQLKSGMLAKVRRKQGGSAASLNSEVKK